MIVKNRFIDIKQLLLKINLNSITKMARLDMKPLTESSDVFRVCFRALLLFL